MYSLSPRSTEKRTLPASLAVLSLLLSSLPKCVAFPSAPKTTAASVPPSNAAAPGAKVVTGSFSVPLGKVRETSFWEKFESLWTDPRPVTSLIGGGGGGGGRGGDDDDCGVPYVTTTGPFEAAGFRFEVLLYPRGLLAKPTSLQKGEGPDPNAPASAYLRFLPDEAGDEIDAAWTLRLVVDGASSLPVSTSGGLPRSTDTWSSAMTLCSTEEAVLGVGRTNDWGSSIWRSADVCGALRGEGDLRAEGNVTIFATRGGETSFSFSWPLGTRGGVGAIRRAAAASNGRGGRPFRAGEVVVPAAKDGEQREEMERAGVYPGIEYRVMTLSDAGGNAIFTTESMGPSERGRARLALRPVGWKTQQLMWERRGVRVTDWPVEVDAALISSGAKTRFNVETFFPRLVSWIAADGFAVLAFFALAIAPLPLALAGRTFVSLYDIPSASMDPTLRRGDVLLVEKFPGVFNRIERGDVVLFEAPPALDDIIVSRGGRSTTSSKRDIKNPFGGESLFVKRVVGMPGDRDIVMDPTTEDVSVNGITAVGPDRNQCDDEPLKLIDRLLEDGKGKNIETLGEDEVYVLGDCKAVSVDSRVFGLLPRDLIVGKPIARIFPFSRFSIGPNFKL